MSASLVGSEMCIRDRGSSWGVHLYLRSTPDAQRLKPNTALKRLESPSRDCLLYTSDAADDM
eukprot:2142341-Alexandrium_andersonii.AAC.1